MVKLVVNKGHTIACGWSMLVSLKCTFHRFCEALGERVFSSKYITYKYLTRCGSCCRHLSCDMTRVDVILGVSCFFLFSFFFCVFGYFGAVLWVRQEIFPDSTTGIGLQIRLSFLSRTFHVPF